MINLLICNHLTTPYYKSKYLLKFHHLCVVHFVVRNVGLNGQAIAAVVSVKDIDLESFSLSENPDFIEVIEKARKEFKTGKRVSLAEMKREMLG
ncbi:MAG: hypothetical protein F6K39_02395 [Okeania sp. SIO3B3]|nr:hypothetical protein [Okeania sp. SIO3B3]